MICYFFLFWMTYIQNHVIIIWFFLLIYLSINLFIFLFGHLETLTFCRARWINGIHKLETLKKKKRNTKKWKIKLKVTLILKCKGSKRSCAHAQYRNLSILPERKGRGKLIGREDLSIWRETNNMNWIEKWKLINT